MLLVAVVLSSAWIMQAPRAAEAETLRFGRFGTVALYRGHERPSQVVLFISGDGGWNLGVVSMATALADAGVLVAGIDITAYLRALHDSSESCSYPAGDFEALSQFVQQHLKLPIYTPPLLIGYSSGATLAYGTLVQAPPGTFRGAISLGFCPDLPLVRPLCRGNGLEWQPGPQGRGIRFLPAPTLAMPWVALQGEADQVCDASATAAFVKQVGHGEIVLLPKVGHGFSVEKNWMPQLRDAVSRIGALETTRRSPVAAALADLPLVEVPASSTERFRVFAVIVSGDGGWASLDRQVGQALAAQGIPVVGLDSLQYFWHRKTPEEAALALGRILRHYLEAWQRDAALLIGYSRGADVLPFMANRLPGELLDKIALIALLGPGLEVDFEFHFTDWVLNPRGGNLRPVLPEVERLRGKRILCVYGREEPASLCPKLQSGRVVLDARPGAHHFGGDYEAIAQQILSALEG
jgi:type IV secretory pathway VirJ component